MTRFLIIALQVATMATFAATSPLENFCSPFAAKDCEVIWSTPTNQLPRSVKVFRVVPKEFSPSVISNLLQVAGLKSDQRKRVDQDGVFAGKDVRFFADRKETRQLNLIPSQGFIVISRLDAVAQIPKEMPVGVPDSKAALQLTLELLRKVGISQSELATNSNGKINASYSAAEVIHKDKVSGQITTNVVQREIYLSRQIEGIPIWGGNSGVTTHLGSEGKVRYLSIVWRSIQPERDCPIPTGDDFVSRIKSGRTLIPDVSPFKTAKDRTFKHLTITKLSLYYWENSGSEPQSHIYPFAVLDAKTDQAGENASVQLFVSLTE